MARFLLLRRERPKRTSGRGTTVEARKSRALGLRLVSDDGAADGRRGRTDGFGRQQRCSLSRALVIQRYRGTEKRCRVSSTSVFIAFGFCLSFAVPGALFRCDTRTPFNRPSTHPQGLPLLPHCSPLSLCFHSLLFSILLSLLSCSPALVDAPPSPPSLSLSRLCCLHCRASRALGLRALCFCSRPSPSSTLVSRRRQAADLSLG